ncbi:MAG: hypothetical protein HEQ40_15065 [Lacibacter sp.]|jgi:hypothetical protein
MKHYLSIVTALLFYSAAFSQAKDRFNIFTYKKPQGFIVLEQQEKLYLEKKEGRQYCQLIVYPVTPSAGSVEKDFEAHWNFFARNPQQQVGDPEVSEYDSSNGWTVLFGAARGIYNKQNFAITVTTFTKANQTYYIASVFSDKKFTEVAQAFTSEVVPDEKKLSTTTVNASTNTYGTGSNIVNPAATTITTEYSDGWTSTYIGPYVTVTKGDLKVWIFPVNDSLDKVARKPEELLEDKYWRYAVNRFFQTRNVAERPWQMRGTGSDKIFEAEVKNRQTGEESFVAMRVIWNSGRAQPVLAFAASKEQLYKSVFAQYNSFEQVLVYNKFAVTPHLLRGMWRSSEAGATGSYSIAGGFQGGNAKLGFKDEFIFKADGSYESMHGLKQRNESTAEGYVQRYKGSYTFNSETLQLTGWRKDDPGIFECWMEAVHGGLALIIVNKKFTGQKYYLFRVK